MARKELQPKDDAPPEEPMSGGPGQEEPVDEPKTAPAASEPRFVTINGRKFPVDDDLAGALSEREKAYDRKMQEQSNELGNLRKFYQEHQPKPPAPAQKTYGTLVFEDPDLAFKRHEDEIVNKLRLEYAQEKRAEAFWHKFYRDNRDTLDREAD